MLTRSEGTVTSIAKLLGVSRSTIYQYVLEPKGAPDHARARRRARRFCPASRSQRRRSPLTPLRCSPRANVRSSAPACAWTHLDPTTVGRLTWPVPRPVRSWRAERTRPPSSTPGLWWPVWRPDPGVRAHHDRMRRLVRSTARPPTPPWGGSWLGGAFREGRVREQ
ncbi:helix-turn-helix domain-containing protein [Saccharopolyspora rhizosphaerae]|uniref:helix-turn-helix domain-containing protein n=1 Tax=Saccharopolyspora rhizosphaerae TaxID=2492662 RepID=UPI001F379DB2|nr:helix-turn-helix domain-containing protein [Saccharopolyspora rhizosphaerae]